MLALIARILGLIANAIPLFLSFYAGVKTEQNEGKEEILDEVKEAKEAVDSLNTNPAFAKWVRDKFTRK